MAVRFHHRVRALERRLGGAGEGCAVCHGRGVPGLSIVASENEPDVTKRTRGCHACGKISSVVKYVILRPEGAGPDWDPWEVI